MWQILAGGVVGIGFVCKWYAQHRPAEWQAHASDDAQRIEPMALVTSQADVDRLLSEVRRSLNRFGVSLGKTPLRVRLLSETHAIEGMTTKVVRPPPVLRGVEAIYLRRNLTALSTAQVLAHEYTHAWLWLQGFPVLDTRLEEGL